MLFRSKKGIIYSAFSMCIQLFTLLGILGTVAGLYISMNADQNIYEGVEFALSSTVLGIIFAVFYKFCDILFVSIFINYIEDGIDFNKLLVKSKESTFCLHVGGNSLSGDGIFEGDLLVVDKLEEPYENAILIFSIDGEFTMKRLEYRQGHVALLSSNPEFEPIIINEGEELKRWGVVKYVIKKF